MSTSDLRRRGTSDQPISWDEIKKHAKKGDAWIVINEKVYDISRWSWKHPGGRVIMNYAGEDATDVFRALHPHPEIPEKYLKSLYVGTVQSGSGEEDKHQALLDDFRILRKKVEDMGLFRANWWFYIWNFMHVVLLEALGYLVLYYSTGWFYWILSAVLLATAQAQAGWLQHDFGHLSVASSSRWNHYIHHITVGALKGASHKWWNWRHFNHHSKPNVTGKDPDIGMAHVFVLGKNTSKRWGLNRRKSMPYQFQHRYWFFIGPPLLIPLYFPFEIVRFVIKKRAWPDIFWFIIYHIRFFMFTVPALGWGGSIGLYFFMRFLESHWFVWVTQMNHIPMFIERDQHKNWPLLQVEATCNVEPGTFNDWFTGHLNYQVEHHLFPTMPRHNYRKIAPFVKEMYRKHNVPYEVKSLSGAFSDIVSALKDYGNIWYRAYYQLD